MKLKRLLEGIDVKIDSRLREIEIISISTDSRAVKEGSLFVAIEGFKFDGHKFVDQALLKGARASMVDAQKRIPRKTGNIIEVADTRKALSVIAKNFYHSPSEKLKVIGITGTNGKTTTSFLIQRIFQEGRIPCGLIGTMEYQIGKRRIPAQTTTPDALFTNFLLDRMIKNGLKAVSMEVSSHALDQKRVDDIFFDTTIFTNLSHEHLDYHGNLGRYLRAKTKIFKNLKSGGFAILNLDDKYARVARKKITPHNYITYGLNKTADVSARVEKVELDGTSFVVRIHKKARFRVDTKLIGLHNISNILAAVAAGFVHGIELDAIRRGVEKLNYVPGRLEQVTRGEGPKVFIDYAHTHNALENVLGFLNRMKKRNLITVFGCGGERDRKKRPLMGHVAQRFSNFVIITNDNPRSEDPEKIIRDIRSGMNGKKGNYAIIPDRKEAIERALKDAGIGDIVLIAGKGHEKFQIVGDRKMPFDDKRVTEEILRKAQ